MMGISKTTLRVVVFLAFFALSFALYAAAESGSAALELALLGAMVALMLLAILVG